MGKKLLRVTLHRPAGNKHFEINYAFLWWKNSTAFDAETLGRINLPWYRVLAYDKLNKEN